MCAVYNFLAQKNEIKCPTATSVYEVPLLSQRSPSIIWFTALLLASCALIPHLMPIKQSAGLSVQRSSQISLVTP